MSIYSYRFIKKFGTHIVVGVKMGGKDVIYLKQQHSSSLQAVDVQKRLKEMSDQRFLDANGHSDISLADSYAKDNKVFTKPLNILCVIFSCTLTASLVIYHTCNYSRLCMCRLIVI